MTTTTIICGFIKKSVIRRDDQRPYLIRWSILTTPWFAIKVHRILISDDDCLHDHPWAFITCLLRGSYVEHSQRGNERVVNKYRAGQILYRHLHYIHRLEIDKPVTSLVITFRKRKSWGFFNPKGWVHYKTYKPSGSCEN